MPGVLEAEKRVGTQSREQLDRPRGQDEPGDGTEGDHGLEGGDESSDRHRSIHPYVRPLTLADIEGCLHVENLTFPEHERCSREKVRLELGPHVLLAPIRGCLVNFAFDVYGVTRCHASS